MKSISLWQPWASLIPLGFKAIETRGWSTGYRGPLAIHATKKCIAGPLGDFTVEKDNPRGTPPAFLLRGPIAHPYRLPLGAVVAICNLVDVVPILGVDDPTNHEAHVVEARHAPGQLILCRPGEGWSSTGLHNPVPHFEWKTEDITSQAPYGDYSTPGRYAWLLEDIEPIVPMSAVGHQLLWEWSTDGI